MADLLPSLASDDERPLPDEGSSDEEEDGNEVDKSFQFGGILVSAIVVESSVVSVVVVVSAAAVLGTDLVAFPYV